MFITGINVYVVTSIRNTRAYFAEFAANQKLSASARNELAKTRNDFAYEVTCQKACASQWVLEMDWLEYFGTKEASPK